MKSDVYFVQVTSNDDKARAAALKKVAGGSGFCDDYKNDEIIPVKITLGDSACAYNVKPELVSAVIREITGKKAKPFLFDTSVIYKGQRQNAIDHMRLAQAKGFDHGRIGAPFIIADGLLGQDGREFKIEGRNITKVKVPSFVGMLDSLVVLSHATGHIVSGFAGALKNVAMGMSCRATKQVQHSSLKPEVVRNKCTACACCINICPVQAIELKEGIADIDKKTCIGCGECLCACKFDAISINWHEDPKIFCRRMDEVAKFILSKFKNKFFITFALDITKECDCISDKNDTMISPSLGIFASRDAVSVDKAVVDHALEEGKSDFLVKVKDVYEDMFDYAEEIGAGSKDYNLIKL